MKERDIQDYLYANPEILFPSGNITEKACEYYINGKRIDLLFVVDGIRYIVEVKNSPIQREHIGQVVEYYGLMRQYMKDSNLAMILVSSSIPEWRAVYLEELGIRCVEISNMPESEKVCNRLQKDARAYNKKAKLAAKIDSMLRDEEVVSFEDIAGPVSPKGLAFSRRMLRDSLESVRKSFDEYDIVPFSIKKEYSHDYDLEYYPDRKHGCGAFIPGGIWWAYRFGFSVDLPPNDAPNVSVIANSTGLDVTLNAELQPSQKIMLDRIQDSPEIFNDLLANHGNLWLKTYLKFEHQPRFYHWILSEMMPPGEFNGQHIQQLRLRHSQAFAEERELWIQKIAGGNKKLTDKQISHLKARNKRLNLAIRLVEPYNKSATFWSFQPKDQASEVAKAVQRMKPLMDFFIT